MLQARVFALYGICAAGLFGAAAANGATVSYVGVQTDHRDWRSTSVAKSFDPDGDGAYGTAGYAIRTGTTSPPDTTQSLPAGMAIGGVNFSYGNKASIDNPALGIAATVTDINSGIMGSTNTAGTSSVLTITLGTSVPANGYRVGIITDNATTDNPTSFTMAGPSVAAVSSGILTKNNVPDLVFFDINGAPGDVFTMTGVATSGLKGYIAGFSFDAVPEPTSLGAVSLGAFGMLARRRSRR